MSSVHVRTESISIPTYEPYPPDRNPMFLERRVYQGSSGKVYPLPFYNRISEEGAPRLWQAIHLENEFVSVMLLPEIGGRIHTATDRTNGYDFIYRQTAIKPALVGLSGPWASGGIEFNWPQHHRPGTYMPVDVEVERHADGSITVWMGDHDPLLRLKGMHGVCLHPGRSVIELKARAYNRTAYIQTFLWWANLAVRANEGYRSFFPPDVQFVADHAKRATSRYPLCDSTYYGVAYGERARHGIPPGEVPSDFIPPHSPGGTTDPRIPRYAPNDLSWYANIPVPTSYMCLGSQGDFSGGYDYLKGAGLIQYSNHHIAPGKKQWTWGNHEFGYAWDRNLTDGDGPYLELMTGVYTDNQPDFSFLQPGETKTWSIYWYPIQQIGAAQHADLEAAIALAKDGSTVELGVAVTRSHPGARVELRSGSRVWLTRTVDLGPGSPLRASVSVPSEVAETDLTLAIYSAEGLELSSYRPQAKIAAPAPEPATEPAMPAEVGSADELYLIGLHLSQYRHATRSPVLYWTEALRRDAGDARCNNGMGLWHLKRGEWDKALGYFRTAIARLTSRNPNPADGEAYYHCGLTLRFLGREAEAYDCFYKATWNQAWQGAAFHLLAQIDSTAGRWDRARDHLERSLRMDTQNLRARNLLTLVRRQLGRSAEADALLAATRTMDPLDWWSRHLAGAELSCDNQTRLDLAIDYRNAGFLAQAIALLKEAKPEPLSGTLPLLRYYLASYAQLSGDLAGAARFRAEAARENPDYCFPARLEDIGVLEAALAAEPTDGRARYYLGNLFYHLLRHEEAIALWRESSRLQPNFSIPWRNLGIGLFNVAKDSAGAREAYERALAADPSDGRLVFERDQLWKRLNVDTAARLAAFEANLELVRQRDDALIEYCALLNQQGRPADALAILEGHRFQPWEGGEGQVLGQYVRAQLIQARAQLAVGDASAAQVCCEQALHPPDNLGEMRHLLTNAADIHLARGDALAKAVSPAAARASWEVAAASLGDFQAMSVRRYSEMTYFAALALIRLRRTEEARKLFEAVLAYAAEWEATPAKIDYFATSLPTMLLFEDDLQFRQTTQARFLRAQALAGLARRDEALAAAREVLGRDASHALAADLLNDLSTP